MYFPGALNVIIRRDIGPLTAGRSYSLTCTVILDEITGSPTIQWLDPNSNLVSNSTNVTMEDMVMVNDSVYDRTLVFSRVLTSHGGQYTCQAVLGRVFAMATTELLVQGVCVYEMNVIPCTLNSAFSLQFLHQQSPSHPTALVFSMLALPSPSPAPFS